MPKPRKSSFDDGYIAIIERLVIRRRELGMTQEQLAEAYGEDQSFISRVERRQRRIDVWEFVLFCQALDLDPGEEITKGFAKSTFGDFLRSMAGEPPLRIVQTPEQTGPVTARPGAEERKSGNQRHGSKNASSDYERPASDFSAGPLADVSGFRGHSAYAAGYREGSRSSRKKSGK